MPVRESTLERNACKLIEATFTGAECRKDGRCGYPDRFVLMGHNRHVWIEFKTEIGRLTPAQRRVFPRLEKLGETIIYAKGKSAHDVMTEVLDAACGRAKVWLSSSK